MGPAASRQPPAASRIVATPPNFGNPAAREARARLHQAMRAVANAPYPSFANTSRAAATVASISASPCAADTKPASKAEGAK